MNWLFIHQNFPGQYLHAVQRLAAAGDRVVFLSQPNENRLSGVHRVRYMPPIRSPSGIHPDAADLDAAVARAEAVAAACRRLAATGFRPDMLVGHNGWGELLNVKDVWPDVPVLGYFEFYYATAGTDVDFDPEFPLDPGVRSRVRARNAVNLLGLQVVDGGQTPTRWQQATYPAWARERIRILPEGVDVTMCAPRPGATWQPRPGAPALGTPATPLVTYVARNLEPYRGFHVLMRALPRLLAAHPGLHVVIVGGDGVSYGRPPVQARTWRDAMLAEVGSRLDAERVHFVGRIEHAEYIALLQASSAHVYLTYPFVCSWSLREALACGCAVVASDTAPVREFVEHEVTGLLVPFHDPAAVAEGVLRCLGTGDAAAWRREAARRAATMFSLERCHGLFLAEVDRLLTH